MHAQRTLLISLMEKNKFSLELINHYLTVINLLTMLFSFKANKDSAHSSHCSRAIAFIVLIAVVIV